jgi:DNA-binding transcriptional LysR family regulator
MSIRNLKTLQAVLKHGSFAAAADALGLTPSAVSLQVKGLETELRTSLFDRSRRPLTLSANGAALVEQVNRVVAAYEDLGRVLSNSKNIAGKLKIGAVPTTQTGILPEALCRLTASHRQIQVQIVTGLSAELTALVDDGELDAALVTQPMVPLNRRLTWLPFASDPLIVIAPQQAVGRFDRQLLERYPLIRFNRRAWLGRLIENALRQKKIKIHPIMELDSLEAITVMVSKGLGVSIVPRRRLEVGLSLPLRTVPFGNPPVRHPLGLVEISGQPLHDLTALLVRELRALAAYQSKNIG